MMAFPKNKGGIVRRCMRGLILILLLMVTPAWGSNYETEYYQNAINYYRALEKNSAVQYRSSWLNAIERFEYFYFNFPRSENAPKAMYHAAHAYLKLYRLSSKTYDLEQALNTFRTLSNRYPESNLADDGAFLAGEVYEIEKGDLVLALRQYEQVLNRFPSGDMVAKARERIESINNRVAGSPPSVVQAPAKSSAPANTSSNSSARLINIDTYSNDDYTRAVLRFSDDNAEVSFKRHWLREDRVLGKPPRLFIDIFGVDKDDNLDNITLNNTQLTAIRAARFDRDTLRVVFDINTVDDFNVFTLKNPTRLVIDLNSNTVAKTQQTSGAMNTAAVATPSKIEPSTSSSTAVPVVDAKGKLRPGQTPSSSSTQIASLTPTLSGGSMSLARQLGLHVNRVVIDAGHGGRDPGAIGYRGLREKDVVLDLSLKVADYLRRHSTLDVLLTRTTDVFLPLEARTAFANTKKADMFISIHANASRNTKAFGIETYFLNIATDPEAMELAARENAISEKSVSDLQGILKDLMMNSKISESTVLAQAVHRQLVNGVRQRYPDIPDKGVKKAPFYVLIGAQMPSILLEVGFISNRREGELLASPAYRELLAEHIARGIMRYAAQ
ncbi:N-acetylmuramoyl-L-alanine amidase [Chrysiogenes arsenatis]|uniref:N-acetylmuramoyl-L-alanine amidase n=1 Tax=Chrysiogenes arsenatis TaxID=309797 RepID=UPI00041162F5|nr:N-acetylmuramoyl-L-alanine amidase [Chrysiogenes arsenatis]